ncbi:MAG: hypothetical protein H6724_03485 [Sandaracinus sp.]|nr:hypothetical protein [Sandaracinus sp.]
MPRTILCLFLMIGCTCEKDEGPVDAPASDRATATRPTLAAPTTLTFAAEEPAQVVSLALSPDGVRVAASGWGKRIVSLPLDGSPGTELHRIGDGDLFQDGAMAWSDDRLAVGTFSFLVLLDPAGTTIAQLEGRTHSVAAHGAGFVRAVDFAAVELVGADGVVGTRVDLADVREVASTDDAVFALATDGGDYVLVELDPITLAERGRSAAPGNAALASAADGRLVLVSGDTTTLTNGRATVGPIARGDFPEDLTSFSIDGPWMAGLGFNRGVALFDLGTRTLLARADSENGEDIVLDGDRRVIAAGAGGVYVFAITRE